MTQDYKFKLYNGYRLSCEECGDKSATWVCESNQQHDMKWMPQKAMQRAIREVALEAHGGHNFHFLKKVIGVGSKDELLRRLNETT